MQDHFLKGSKRRGKRRQSRRRRLQGHGVAECPYALRWLQDDERLEQRNHGFIRVGAGIEKALTVFKKDNVMDPKAKEMKLVVDIRDRVERAKEKKPVLDIRDRVERAKEKKPVLDIRDRVEREVELKKDNVMDPKAKEKKPKKKVAKGGKTKESGGGGEDVAATRMEYYPYRVYASQYFSDENSHACYLM